ncbi:MAG: hypothetical protein OSA97_14910 [Nevskia sp.]|nr:hypothetical protein [Nevskia sp.]
MPKSILLEKPKTAQFHCRIGEELNTRLKVLQQRLKKLGGGAVFPIDQIVEDALERAAKLAEAELDRREGHSGNGSPA